MFSSDYESTNEGILASCPRSASDGILVCGSPASRVGWPNGSGFAAQGAQAEVEACREQEAGGDERPVREWYPHHRHAAPYRHRLQAAEQRQDDEAEEKQQEIARGLLTLLILARQRQGFAKQEAEHQHRRRDDDPGR